MFQDLERFLSGMGPKPFVFIPNPGNAGDSLIAYATFRLFEKLSLQYEIGDHRAVYPGRVLVYSGGGNLVDYYPQANRFLQANHSVCKMLVVLPHTVRSYEETLSKLGPNCFIFCREQPSYEFVKRHATHAICHLSHDVALSTDFNCLRGETQLVFPWRTQRPDVRKFELKRTLKTALYRLKNVRSPRSLNAYRTDPERTDITIPRANIDISHVCRLPLLADTIDIARHASVRMMQIVDRFTVVRTNRLHVAILAGILGKFVELYDNCYGKNRAVYEHSLRNRFENITWCGS